MLSLFSIVFTLHAQEPDFFNVTGYATINGNTTGGTGGDVDTVTTGTALQTLLTAKKSSATPLTIYISGQINLDNSTGFSKIDIKEVQDVSIIGLGASAEFNGIGLKIYKSSNIIVRNVKVHHVLSGDKDCIGIEGPADHIWIDHCELYNEYQGVDKDYYDGLLDAKAEAEYITYSWNYLHDSWKAMLVGSSESDNFDRKLTMHHNLFENINSRLPLFRSSTGHFFNNYYKDVFSTAINSRINSCAKIENNYFENVNNPWVSAYSDILGGGDTTGNILVNSPFVYSDDTHELPACELTVPYNYSAFLHDGIDVPGYVTAYAGVGKLDVGNHPIYMLSTTTSGNGTISISPEKVYYDSGEVVTLTAVPETDWKFEGWSGSETNADNPLELVMNANKTLHASFITDKKTLTYSSSGPGTISVEPDLVLYDSGSTVTLTAEAFEGAYFLSWSGDVESSNNPLTIKTDSNITLIALFAYKADSILSIQVEEEFCYLQGSVETEHSGFTGSGFVDFENAVDSKLDFAIGSNKDISCTMKIRYAHGKTDERSIEVYVNDNLEIPTIDFAPTGAWTTWDTVVVSISLTAGNNMVSLRSLTESGSANIDKIDFSCSDTALSIGSCPGDTNALSEPTDLTATLISSSEVSLAWTDNSSRESSYIIQRKENDGEFAELGQTEANVFAYSDKSVSNNQTYTYRVKAVGDAGESAWSNSVELTVSVPTYTLTVLNDLSSFCGYVDISPNQTNYDSASVVTLSVKITGDCLFYGWSGDIHSEDSIVTITMDDNKTVSADFWYKDNIKEFNTQKPTILVYPNPINHSGEISFTVLKSSEIQINLINAVGIKSNIYNGFVQGGQTGIIKIQSDTYKPGLYIVEMISGTKRTLTKMIIVK